MKKDFEEGNLDRGRYDIKEIDKSQIAALERNIKILGIDDNSVKLYRNKLDKIKKEFNL